MSLEFSVFMFVMMILLSLSSMEREISQFDGEKAENNIPLGPNVFSLLYNISNRLDGIDKKMGDIEKKFDKKMGDIEKKFDKKMEVMDKKFDKKMGDMDKKMDKNFVELKWEMESMENRTRLFFNGEISKLLIRMHSDNHDKVRTLAKSSTSSEVCDQYVTAHYVYFLGKMFGISVAHTPCYYPSSPPSFLHACPDVDVSIWAGCPPTNVSLLNISNTIVEAKLGDSATAFGFSGGEYRTWHGYISKRIGRMEPGKHFSPNPPSHESEFLFSAAAQDLGMSGGGVINGKGKLSFV
jgi:hypothetical protein